MKQLFFALSVALFMAYGPLSAGGEDCVRYVKAEPQLGFGRSLPHSLIPYPAIDANQVVNVFLEAVDRGELVVFQERVLRHSLEPKQVEYIYTLESALPTVKVFSILKEPLPLPSMPGVTVVGVAGVLDQDGTILESIVHCQ